MTHTHEPEYRVDFEPVRALLKAKQVWHAEQEIITQEVIATTRKYAEEDLGNWSIERVEDRITIPGSIFDLSSGQDLVLKSLPGLPPRIKIVDYKRLGKWNPKNATLYLHGFQAIYYAAFAMKTFDPSDYPEGIDYEVRVKLSDKSLRRFGERFNPKQIALDVTQDLVHLSNMVKAFEKQPDTKWPRNEEACYDFGRKCPFHAICWEDQNEPYTHLPFASYPMTPTFRRTFLRCHEKYRLLSLYAQSNSLGVKEASDLLEPSADSANLGKAYHAGMEEVYNQFRAQQLIQITPATPAISDLSKETMANDSGEKPRKTRKNRSKRG